MSKYFPTIYEQIFEEIFKNSIDHDKMQKDLECLIQELKADLNKINKV